MTATDASCWISSIIQLVCTLLPIFIFAVNLAIVNSTMMVLEGDGSADVCISIDAEIERPITVSINAMSDTALGMKKKLYMLLHHFKDHTRAHTHTHAHTHTYTRTHTHTHTHTHTCTHTHTYTQLMRISWKLMI